MGTSNDPRVVLAELARQREARPELRQVIDLHQAVLTVQAGVSVAEPPAAPAREYVQSALDHGTPLLSPEALQVDWRDFTAVYNDICDVISEHRPELADELASLQGSPESEVRSPKSKTNPESDLELRTSDFFDWTQEKPRSSLRAFVVSSALRPFLWAQAAVLAPLIDDQQWYRSRCPVCGGEPDLAALADEGQRRLLCSRCDTEWLYQRIGCPFCDNADHRKLTYYMSDDEEYRLYVCGVCRRYLKTIDQRDRWQVLPLPVERILTVGMDLAAAEAGYRSER